MKSNLLCSLLCSLLGLASAFASAHTLRLIEGAYEAGLSDVIFPQNAFGMILIEPCADCDQHVVPADDKTRYFGSRGEVELAAFLTEIEEMRQTDESAQQTMVNIYYSIDTGRATRVSLAPL